MILKRVESVVMFAAPLDDGSSVVIRWVFKWEAWSEKCLQPTHVNVSLLGCFYQEIRIIGHAAKLWGLEADFVPPQEEI